MCQVLICNLCSVEHWGSSSHTVLPHYSKSLFTFLSLLCCFASSCKVEYNSCWHACQNNCLVSLVSPALISQKKSHMSSCTLWVCKRQMLKPLPVCGGVSMQCRAAKCSCFWSEVAAFDSSRGTAATASSWVCTLCFTLFLQRCLSKLPASSEVAWTRFIQIFGGMNHPQKVCLSALCTETIEEQPSKSSQPSANR